MYLRSDIYVPSVRWRCGEYQALFHLRTTAKDRVVPFVLIPEVEFDFEEWRPKKTVHEHVHPFARRFKQKWGERPAWIDVHQLIAASPMEDGSLPLAYVFRELRKLGSSAVPVVSIDGPSAVATTARSINSLDRRGVAVRVRLENLMKPSFEADFDHILRDICVDFGDVDLILDLGAPNYEPYTDFADALIAAIEDIANLDGYRSFVLIGTGYPETISLEKPGGDLVRHDWLFYKVLRGKLGGAIRTPNYGDYTIVHPEFTARDMRLIKPPGKVIYTSDNSWFVRKGGSFRDNPRQMHDHCSHIVSSSKFRGASFSEGDLYIEQCARRIAGHSTQTRWKEVAINHHIMHVLDDLSRSAV